MTDDNEQEPESVNEEDDQETDMIEIGKVDAKRNCCPESEQHDTSEIVDSEMGVENVNELPTKKEVLMNEIGESTNGKTDGDGEIVINEYRETQVQKKDDCKGCDASDIKEKTEDREAKGKLAKAVVKVEINPEIQHVKEGRNNESLVKKKEIMNGGSILAPKEKEWETIHEPNECVGLYVVVCYNKTAYPGLVVDAGQSDLYVQCMHHLGKKGHIVFIGSRN